MKSKLIPSFLLGVATVCLPALNASAQLVVSNVGTETGAAVTNWSSASTSKTYDIGGSEVYGTAGYYQIRPTAVGAGNIFESAGAGNNLGTTNSPSPTLFSAPSFLTSTTGTAGNFVNFGGYPNFLGPDGSTTYRQGALSISINGGPFVMSVAPGGPSYFGIVATLTLNSAVDFRLGLVVDAVADGLYGPDFVGIYNATSGTTTSGLLTRNGQPEMVFFDITGGTSGQSFDIALWQTNAPGTAALSMITYDVIPEPSAGMLAVFGLASLGVVHLALKRRRVSASDTLHDS
jgi:hypothetical protein